jgi:hypothetical protein
LSGSCDPWAANAAGAAAIIASASRRVKRIDTSNLSKLNSVPCVRQSVDESLFY